MYRGTEEHKLWLFDLAHGNLQDDEILKGFIKYYVLSGCVLSNVIDDIVFRTHYDLDKTVGIKNKLTEVLEKAGGIETEREE